MLGFKGSAFGTSSLDGSALSVFSSLDLLTGVLRVFLSYSVTVAFLTFLTDSVIGIPVPIPVSGVASSLLVFPGLVV